MKTTSDSDSFQLSLRTKLGYATGNLAMGIMANSIGFWLLLYYTDIVGLSGAFAGVALAVGRFWDAITDPMMGHISDRTRSRLGRRRAYILLGSPFLAVAFVLLWCPPMERSPQMTFAYLLAVQLLFTTMQTVVMVPYSALGAELTMDYHERNSVMAYQQGALLLGMVIGACLINLASVIGLKLDPGTGVAGTHNILQALVSANSYGRSGGSGFRIAALALAAVTVLSYLCSVCSTRENPHFQRHSTMPPIRSLLSTLKNRPFRIYILAFFVSTTAAQIGVFMLPYLVIHWLHKPSYVLPGYAMYAFGVLGGLPVWRAIGQRLEKKDCYRVSLAFTTAAAFLFLLIVRPAWPASVLIWGTLAGMSNGGSLMCAPSMLADIIDTDELECGLRREGSFMGVNSFIMKCATSLGALWVGPGLTLVGYDGQASMQSDKTLLMMRLMYVVPALIYLCVIAIMSRFPLTSRVMFEVRRTIDAHKENG